MGDKNSVGGICRAEEKECCNPAWVLRIQSSPRRGEPEEVSIRHIALEDETHAHRDRWRVYGIHADNHQ